MPDVTEFQIADVAALEKQIESSKNRRKPPTTVRPMIGFLPLLRRARMRHSLQPPTPLASPAPAVRRLGLLRDERLIELYEDDRLIACFPCTPGSREVPVPTGTWKITANVLMPHFRWDKSVLEMGVRSENAYNLPPGPNNPVGIVWMAINRPSVGMHGTPTPDRIGRNESHGCIRMSNWDAFVLSQLVAKGTPVEVK